MLCERACPSDCITVEGAKLEGAKKKSVTHYVLDFTKCSLCGSCVEACRDGAIRFSREYNLAGLSKEEYVMDLFKRLENEAKNSVPEAGGQEGPQQEPSSETPISGPEASSGPAPTPKPPSHPTDTKEPGTGKPPSAPNP
jgi:formate hydrogenlyase subunit 6/NADH:ubiquinone oxidoreductase subunit I